MDFDKTALFTCIKEQLALEYNCLPCDFTRPDNIVTQPALHENRRRFTDGACFFKMATLGGNAVLSADARLHDRLAELASNQAGHWLFEHQHLRDIDKLLEPYGELLWQTHHMFLPKPPTEALPLNFPVRWFEQAQIYPFYEGTPFPNALSETFSPSRPDTLAVAAYDGDKIIGMAGCSADTPLLWQIGIDVDKTYRGQRIGAGLVSLLKNEIIRRGKIPYYGTSLSNLYSWRIALSCGFYPAWVEVETQEHKSIECIDGANVITLPSLIPR